jgi:hypothetical protein
MYLVSGLDPGFTEGLTWSLIYSTLTIDLFFGHRLGLYQKSSHRRMGQIISRRGAENAKKILPLRSLRLCVRFNFAYFLCASRVYFNLSQKGIPARPMSIGRDPAPDYSTNVKRNNEKSVALAPEIYQ